jgi:DNA-binding NarL/FixJ family response regulator
VSPDWNTLRILIADDHETVRKGVCAILTAHNDIEICGEAANGKDAVQRALELKPDLVILDLSMPIVGGLDAGNQIRSALPGIPILILSMHEGDKIAEASRLAGAQRFVCKSNAGQVLLKALEALMNGQTFFHQH